MRQYITNEKYELIKDNLDSKDTYVIVDGENVDKVAFRTNNITGQNAMYEIIPGALPTGTYNITENGEYDVAAYASAYVDVPSPEGTYNITENGEYDVAAYASAYVDVPMPEGTYNITENGEYDVTAYASAYVDVPSGGGEWEGYYRDAMNGTIAYLDSTTMPSGVTNLRPRIFEECTGITYVDLPNVTSIGDYAFNGCTGITYVDLPNVTSIGKAAFILCTGITYVNIPNATSIGESAFGGCTGITYVNIPNATSIGGSAFGEIDSLTTVDIGPNVTNIGFMAFASCTNLTSFTCRATTPPTLGFSAFDDAHADLVIYVPAESVATYKAASGWSDYADKIQAIA